MLLTGGLLRNYAEITKALDSLNKAVRPASRGELAPGLPKPRERDEALVAASVAGPLVGGGFADIALSAGGPNTVLGFLSSGCMTCHTFWAAFQADVREPLPGGAQLVVVTHDSNRESPSKLAQLAPADVPVVMCSEAWEAYEVPAAPYFVYVDGGTGNVHGEGSALEWEQVKSLLTDALFDAAEASGTTVVAGGPSTSGGVSRGESNRERNLRADAALRDAGVSPNDPTLWPQAETERSE